MEFFFGFKLHLATNTRGNILGVYWLPTNHHDVEPVEYLLKDYLINLEGKSF